jgi:colicin import membrane protein
MAKPSVPMTAVQKAERLRLQAIDGAAARAEYDAAVMGEEDKTLRLRALRMERDRLEAEAAVKAARAAKAAKAAKARKIKAKVQAKADAADAKAIAKEAKAEAKAAKASA